MPLPDHEIQCKLFRYYCVMHTNCDLPDLRAFCQLVASGSFNKTADLLAISPSALSRRIGKLEDAIGGRLVERTTRSMVLTPLGLTLHARLLPLLGSLEDCLSQAQRTARGATGQVTVACLTTVAFSLFPDALGRFRLRHPDVRVDLRDDTGARVRNAVIDRDAEFGVTILWEDEPDLHCTYLGDDPYVLGCPVGHPLARRKRLSWKELSAHRILALRPSSANRQQVDAALAEAGVAAPWFDEVEHLSSMIGFLEHGKALAVLPRMALMATSKVAAVPLDTPTIARKLYLIKRRDVTLGVAAQALWDDLLTVIQGAPAETPEARKVRMGNAMRRS